MVANPQIQTKLSLSHPGDAHEREADQVASRVMRMPAPRPAGLKAEDAHGVTSTGRPPVVARSARGPASVDGRTAADLGRQPPGVPLPSSVRNFMEPRFGADFGHVRIHTGSSAAILNRRLSARAFTLGHQVFFGQDQFRPDSHDGRHLIAHELTHTIQQGSASQGRRVAVTSPVSPVGASAPLQVQRMPDFPGIGALLDYIADAANAVPGFRMFTIAIGVNPINMAPVDRSTANLLRAVVEFLPGGALITSALDRYGVFQRAGTWVDQQLRSLGITGPMIRQAFDQFMATLSWRDAFHPSDVWRRAVAIFRAPIDRILAFIGRLFDGIVELIKDAILRPLAALASQTRGWDLLCAVLGRNPITGEAVPRTAETLIGGFMKLIGQEEIWYNMKRANAVARAWAWFQNALHGLLGFVQQVPRLFLEALHELTIQDIVVLSGAFAKVARTFGGFLEQFMSWAGQTVWSLLKIIFEVVAPGVLVYLERAAGAFHSILNNPVGFARNLLAAAKLGFEQFAAHIGAHLRTSLVEWLTGALSGAGIYIPQALTLAEIGKFVLSVLGITWAQIRGKIVRALGANGETIMRALETGFDVVVALVRGGPAAAWDVIKEKIGDLKEMVMQAILGFVEQRIVQAAVTKLLSLLSPVGAFIQAIISIYNTIKFFIERLQQIAAVVATFIDSIAAIASGAIGGAANRVEQTLGGLLTLVISFLARLVGLGGVSEFVVEKIRALQERVDRALDTGIQWIVDRAKAFFARLTGRDRPDERTEEQKQADLNAAIAEVEELQRDPHLAETDLRERLPRIKQKYKLTALDLVVDSEAEAEDVVHVDAVINPRRPSRRSRVSKEDGTRRYPFAIEWVKPPVSRYPRIELLIGGRRRLVGPTDSTALGDITIGVTNSTALALRNGYVFQLQSQVTGNATKDRMNRVLGAHGYDREEGEGGPKDTDHVLEKQLGGPDEYANLWPLDAATNRSSGSRVRSELARLRTLCSNIVGKFVKIRRA